MKLLKRKIISLKNTEMMLGFIECHSGCINGYLSHMTYWIERE